MIRLGIVDMDTSHCVEFTKRLNHKGIAQDQWVDGATVIGAVRMPSQVTETAKVDAYSKAWTEDLGLPLFEKPEDLIGNIDAVLIEANDGSVHLERARPFLEAGIPCFVDKPFACSAADATIDPMAAVRKVSEGILLVWDSVIRVTIPSSGSDEPGNRSFMATANSFVQSGSARGRRRFRALGLPRCRRRLATRWRECATTGARVAIVRFRPTHRV